MNRIKVISDDRSVWNLVKELVETVFWNRLCRKHCDRSFSLLPKILRRSDTRGSISEETTLQNWIWPYKSTGVYCTVEKCFIFCDGCLSRTHPWEMKLLTAAEISRFTSFDLAGFLQKLSNINNLMSNMENRFCTLTSTFYCQSLVLCTWDLYFLKPELFYITID